MCGICGVVDRRGRDIKMKCIDLMLHQMVHRGPDEGGTYANGPFGLGHRRLSIIDLRTGGQPMFNEDRTVVVVFNGEIYNFSEIKKNLEKKGHNFRSHSDTEVIVHLYEEKGIGFVDVLRGMFSIAIYDSNKEKLVVVRDRLGIKPLYYIYSSEAFVFASEIKPIIKSGFYRPEVDLSAIDSFVTLGYVPGPATAFQGIRKLLPGHLAVYEGGGLQIQKYWDIKHYGLKPISIEDAKEEFHEILRETIGLHLMSDVPLGVFLSGGLDSSSVVAYMKKYFNKRVKTFSVGYSDDPSLSELAYARTVSRHFETEHFEYILTPTDFFESIDLFLYFCEEPVMESAGIALFRLAEYARSEGVIVFLSGEGADEILAGYPLYRIMLQIERMKPLVDRLPACFVDFAISRKFKGEKKLKYLDWLGESLTKRYRTISNDVTISVKKKLYQPEFFQHVGHELSAFFGCMLNGMEGSDLQKMLYVDMKTWLPDDLLIKADKMTMAASVELRVPFLDHKLVEFAASLQDELKLRGKQGKYLLREIMRGVLPEEIIYRKKMGFPVPISKWFEGAIYDKARDILLDGKTISRGYFRQSYLEGIFSKHRTRTEDMGRRIFSLLILELWHRKYIDEYV